MRGIVKLLIALGLGAALAGVSSPRSGRRAVTRASASWCLRRLLWSAAAITTAAGKCRPDGFFAPPQARRRIRVR